jgi:serine protease Do
MKRWSASLACLVVGGAAGSFLAVPFLHGQVANQPVLSKEAASYRDVVKRVLPAVVSIEGKVKKTRTDEKRRPGRAQENQLPDELRKQMPDEMRKFFDEFGRGMPEMDEAPMSGFGSGFIIDPKGIILTNFHVVAGVDQVEVQLTDGRKFLSKDIKGDRKTDLAIVRIDPKGTLPSLELGDSDSMEMGDRVLAIGAPFGLTGTVTQGIVSAKGRNRLNVNMYEDFIQTDAAINPGNSGGPLINLEGKVIGINSAIKSRSGGFQGVGLAIASNMAKNIVRSLQTEGIVRRGYLGVEMRDLAPEVAEKLELQDKSGVEVSKVFEGSPADKAGLQAGDIITRLSGRALKDGQDLRQSVVSLPLNQAVALTVVRDGKPMTLSLTIEEQPDNFGTTIPTRQVRPQRDESEMLSVDKVGVTVKDLTAETAQQLGYKQLAAGALVSKVTENSPAANAGLRPNMLVTRVDREAVKSAADFQEKINKASLDKGILIQVQTQGGGSAYVVLKADSN